MDIQELSLRIKELDSQGKKTEMIPLMQEQIRYIKSVNDKEWLISALNNYAGVLRDTGDADGAITQLQKAREIAFEVYGANSVNFATILSNLANALRVGKFFAEAIVMFNQASDIYAKQNADKALIAGIKHNLSLIYAERGNTTKAFELQKEELALLKELPNKRVPYAIALQNIAATAASLELFDEALQYLALSELLIYANCGLESSLLAGVYNTRAFIFVKQKQFADGKMMFKKALKITEKTYGKQSQAYQSIMKNIEFLENNGDV
ncbi:Tetratricopeptide repeat-containing protein [Granulicatella balaenopterae]|uniref:Tetratricopeptide repeat-containing protein n=1 Tax=Granulicatella balaenopterae TaxID=137733 RepID=A0A1H9HA81_9LACT|nr:tetratricopeptide repeat protein [Granulicatella balaenopterae]SEQ59176.1 Tetratricopeptide repeat-containing protein [Granulicatella balaenopterae]